MSKKFILFGYHIGERFIYNIKHKDHKQVAAYLVEVSSSLEGSCGRQAAVETSSEAAGRTEVVLSKGTLPLCTPKAPSPRPSDTAPSASPHAVASVYAAQSCRSSKP